MDCPHRLVADVAVMAQGQALFVKYRDTSAYDHQPGWFLPDDHLRHLEHPSDAALRILRDQAGIEAARIRLHHVESFGNGWWHLVFHHVAELDKVRDVHPGENVLAAEWFPLDDLPDPSDVAHHGWGNDVLRLLVAGD